MISKPFYSINDYSWNHKILNLRDAISLFNINDAYSNETAWDLVIANVYFPIRQVAAHSINSTHTSW